MERLKQIEVLLAQEQQRKAAAIEVVLSANEQILHLASERNRLLGNTATRHLTLVPNEEQVLPFPNGAA